MLNIKFSSIPFKDGNSARIFYNAIGKKIKDIKINDDALYLLFEDGYQIMIYDNKQECCEERFMSTDDDLEYFIGSKLLGASIKHGGTLISDEEEDEDEKNPYHEIQFLEIQTDKGVFTVVNHNKNNGYYSGFDLSVHDKWTFRENE